MALFISFEGGERSGKSTQAKRLARQFEHMGISTLSIREPGTTNLGSYIRDIIKGNPWGTETISHRAELFLFSAARAELVSKVLSKRMEDSCLVIISDRYVDSTVAYQGYGRRLPLNYVKSVNELATRGARMPDITLLLDCPPAEALKRVGAVQPGLFEIRETGRMDEAGARRFEDEPLSFHHRVRDGYLKLARAEPERWAVINGMEAEDRVFDSICKALADFDKFQEMFEDHVSLEEFTMPSGVNEPTLFSLSTDRQGQ